MINFDIMKDIYILGIESRRDDTSAAVLKNGVLLSNVTASQEVHKAYGGVVRSWLPVPTSRMWFQSLTRPSRVQASRRKIFLP